MKRNLVLALSLVALSLFVAQDVYASPLGMGMNSSSAFDSGRSVLVNLHNASSTPIEVKAGKNLITLQAGKDTALFLPIGSYILNAKATPSHQVNAILWQVPSDIKAATVHIK